MSYQQFQTAFPVEFNLLKLFVVCGVIFFVIVAAAALIALGVVVWLICTTPFALLADLTLRLLLLSLIGIVVRCGVQMVRRSLFRARYNDAEA